MSPEPSGLLIEPTEPRPPLGAALACVLRAQKSAGSSPSGGRLGLPCGQPRAGPAASCCRGGRTGAGPGAPPGRAGGDAPRPPPPPSLPPAAAAAAALPRRGAALKGGTPPPRRTRRSGAARACRCHASARAACARAPAAAPGLVRPRRRGRGGRRRARAPASRAAPLALAAAARASRRLLSAAAARRLHQPLGSASAGRPGRGGPRGRGARLPQLGPGECSRPSALKTFSAAGGHRARGRLLRARGAAAASGQASGTALPSRSARLEAPCGESTRAWRAGHWAGRPGGPRGRQGRPGAPGGRSSGRAAGRGHLRGSGSRSLAPRFARGRCPQCPPSSPWSPSPAPPLRALCLRRAVGIQTLSARLYGWLLDG